jgi:hypothetical protein
VIGFSCRVGAFGRRLLLEYDCDDGMWIAAVGSRDRQFVAERLRDAIAAATGDDAAAPWIVALEDQVLADLNARERPRYPWW